MASEQKKDKKVINQVAGLGLKIGTDIVACGIVGTIMGISLDKIFDTKPIFLIICLILGLITMFKLIFENINK